MVPEGKMIRVEKREEKKTKSFNNSTFIITNIPKISYFTG